MATSSLAIGSASCFCLSRDHVFILCSYRVCSSNRHKLSISTPSITLVETAPTNFPLDIRGFQTFAVALPPSPSVHDWQTLTKHFPQLPLDFSLPEIVLLLSRTVTLIAQSPDFPSLSTTEGLRALSKEQDILGDPSELHASGHMRKNIDLRMVSQ